MSDSIESQVREVVYNFLTTYCPTAFDPTLPENESLTNVHSVESTDMAELSMNLEEKFKIKIEDSEMTRANFDTISNIIIFMKNKLNKSQG